MALNSFHGTDINESTETAYCQKAILCIFFRHFAQDEQFQPWRERP
jgi:hypothetical protein